jgi:hypothetical protein
MQRIGKWLIAAANFLWGWWTVIILVGGFVVFGFWHFFVNTPPPGKILLFVAVLLAVSLIARDRGRLKSRIMDWVNDRRAGPLDPLHEASLRHTATLVEASIRALMHIPTVVVHPFRLKLYSDSDVVVHPGRS